MIFGKTPENIGNLQKTLPFCFWSGAELFGVIAWKPSVLRDQIAPGAKREFLGVFGTFFLRLVSSQSGEAARESRCRAAPG